MKPTRLVRLFAASAAAALVLVACGADDGDVAATEPDAPEPVTEPEESAEEGDEQQFPVFSDPSLPTLDAVFERDRYTTIMNVLPAHDRSWVNTFAEVNLTYSEDPIAPLVGGAAWIVHGEPGLIWPALEQGVADAVIVGIASDKENWNLFTAPHIETPEDLIGARFSAGSIGDTWITVGRIIMRDEFGIDPDDVDWVSMGGGGDARLDAQLAGQLDGFIGQPRHKDPVLEDGGHVLFEEFVNNAQLQFVVLRETMENHRDAVCAFLEGQLEANQWIFTSEAHEYEDRYDEIEAHVVAHGYDPEPVEHNMRSAYPHTWSPDLGADVIALDRQMEIHQGADDAVLSEDFDWRDHVDFSCVWELQEAYGLPLRPDPGEL